MIIDINNDTLKFGHSGLSITFQRTLRIPDDGRRYPLPPGLGSFPIRRVDDYVDRVPEDWRARGGVFLPMYQREAMWLSFQQQHRPYAVKVAVGKVCALTGERWSEALAQHGRQNYLVTPPQPWLDGICVGKGAVRQFVAMPLGMGYTVEGQVTDEERYGGLQLKVFEPREGLFPKPENNRAAGGFLCADASGASCAAPGSARRARRSAEMGIAAGGRMMQKIYPDPHGLSAWRTETASRVFVNICNSMQWRQITGEEAPPTPVTARTYASNHLPWFDLYDEHAATLDATPILSDVKSVKEKDIQTYGQTLQDDDPVDVPMPHRLWTRLRSLVRDGEW